MNRIKYSSFEKNNMHEVLLEITIAPTCGLAYQPPISYEGQRTRTGRGFLYRKFQKDGRDYLARIFPGDVNFENENTADMLTTALDSVSANPWARVRQTLLEDGTVLLEMRKISKRFTDYRRLLKFRSQY